MPKIGLNEIKTAHSLSREVAQGALTEADAANQLHETLGMNYSSAWGYLRKRRQMLEGERYTRTMNIAATRYFLENIHQDEGDAGLRLALSSVRKHAKYYSQQGKSGLPSILTLADDLECQLDQKQELTEVEVEFQTKVSASWKLSSSDRRKLLPKAGHKPDKVKVFTTAFLRNPHVVVETLLRAKGICEGCSKLAPFNRKSNGSPFLEVHHRKTLAKGGDDILENTLALCPNCHRQRHHG